MPRDGSTKFPPDVPGGPVGGQPDPGFAAGLGELAQPPFAVLPNPASVFARRSARFAALAPGHDLRPYLEFLSKLCAAQAACVSDVPAPVLPDAATLDVAHAHNLPPISFAKLDLDAIADQTLAKIAGAIVDVDTTPASRAAAQRVLDATPDQRRAMMRAVLMDEVPGDAIAEHVLAAAAVQVHVARLAAQLDAAKLQNVANGACPACGSGPVASTIVGWQGAHGARYCTCSICATQWNVVRILCLMCGTDKGIAYQSIEGGPGVVLGETCDGCRSYVKILHQHKDPALDPVADDVASLALDLVLGKEGFQRASANPFLLGY